MWPQTWREFIDRNGLRGKEINIPEADDLSGLGGVIEILGEDNAQYEMDELYPGVGVKTHGFVCIAGCSHGTGDPYFLNINDPQPGPIYRIYHEHVFDENYKPEDAVAQVLNSFEDLLRFPIDN